MLRTGTEGFAGVIAGIDYLHLSPFNEAIEGCNDFSERIARNMQLILKQEAHLEKVHDPASGSYYIEALTLELGQNAWNHFVSLDEKGGDY